MYLKIKTETVESCQGFTKKSCTSPAVGWWWLLGLDDLHVTVETLDWWCTGSISCLRVMWIWAGDIFSSEMRGWTQMCGGWWMIPVWRRSCECQQTCAHTKRKASTRTLGKCISRHDQRQEKTSCITFSCLVFSCLLILCGSIVCVYLANDDFYMTAFWRASALKGTCFLKNVNGRGWMQESLSKTIILLHAGLSVWLRTSYGSFFQGEIMPPVVCLSVNSHLEN